MWIRAENQPESQDLNYGRPAGDAKACDRSLDAAIRDEDPVRGFSTRNPSSQIAF
jgi:hypothetical protein